MDELGHLGFVSAASTGFQILVACKNSSGTATAPTGTPAYTVYNSSGTAVGTGSMGASDHDSKTGLRRLSLDVSALTGVAANETYTFYCTYVVGGNTRGAKGVFQTV